MKIALNISGETRWHNHGNNSKNWHEKFEILFDGIDYDLYGHTWDRCEDPMYLENFKSFIKTDQDNIWEKFAKFNVFDLVPYRSHWNEQPEYQELVNGKGDFLQFCKTISLNTYSQIWSWYECMKTIPLDQYDAVVRWRWDMEPVLFDWKKEVFRSNLVDFVNREGEYQGNSLNNPDILTMVPIVQETIHDTCFIMRGNYFKEFPDIIEHLTSTVDHTLPKRETGHELWYNYFRNYKLRAEIGYTLPIICTPMRDNYWENRNSNKKWM